eukprot:COSAG03_NODE_382_length_8333_cov_5.320986_3_plen_76_part_00
MTHLSLLGLQSGDSGLRIVTNPSESPHDTIALTVVYTHMQSSTSFGNSGRCGRLYAYRDATIAGLPAPVLSAPPG